MRIMLAAAAIAAAIAPVCAFAKDEQGYVDKAPAANVQTEAPSDLTVGFGLTGATDYVWRGVSQSDQKPAVFATVSLGYKGFYAGAGTENVRFAGISQEYDLWGGYVADLGPVKLDVGVVRYGYVDAPVKIDTLEGKAALRDYFVARSAQAGLVWIYRERLPSAQSANPDADLRWYLHGLYA
jgi:uncharacterized protein (TIGR02001 family)